MNITKESIQEVDKTVVEGFLKLLTPITDFSEVKPGTLMFSYISSHPLIYDTFTGLSSAGGIEMVNYKNSWSGCDRMLSKKGWYLWDKKKAIEVLKHSS